MLWIVLAGVGTFVLVAYAMLAISGNESREEEQRQAFEPASGLPCRICGVLESAHDGDRITGHEWSARLMRLEDEESVAAA